MSTISRQQQKQILIDTAHHIINRDNTSPHSENLRELARIALASLEAEPVCVIDQSNLDYLKSGSDADVWPASRTEMGDVLLYRAAPPAPVLPRDLEEIIFSIVNAMADEKLRNDESELFSLARKYIEHAKSKLSAAMLQGVEHVSNRDELPDGWVACSDRMPKLNNGQIWIYSPTRGVKFMFALSPSGAFYDTCDSEDDVTDATHWQYMPQPAAPQQEVKP